MKRHRRNPVISDSSTSSTDIIPNRDMGEVEIPLDIIFEILTRLTVKPLFRFKCVSKSWNSLISSKFKSNPKLNIIVKPNCGKSLFSALIHDDDINNNNNSTLHFSELNHPLKLNCTYAHVIDSCGGILLISDSVYHTMYLYNPANNDCRLLPPIPTQTGNYGSHCKKFFGFGYDSYTDDYMVIRVLQIPHVSLEICVYSLRENVWKFIKDESVSLQKYSLEGCSDVVGANGVLYFRTSVPKGIKPGLMCFYTISSGFGAGVPSM